MRRFAYKIELGSKMGLHTTRMQQGPVLDGVKRFKCYEPETGVLRMLRTGRIHFLKSVKTITGLRRLKAQCLQSSRNLQRVHKQRASLKSTENI